MNKETRLRRPAAGERGAAAVEFAVVVPVLLLILYGIIGYGVMLSFRQSVSQSAAEGARAAAVTAAGGSATANAANAVTQAIGNGITCNLAAGTLTNAGTTVGSCSSSTAACTSNTARNCISVTVTYNYSANPMIPNLPLIPMPTTVSYTAVAEVN